MFLFFMSDFICAFILYNNLMAIWRKQKAVLDDDACADVTFSLQYDAAEIQVTSFPPLGECVEGWCLVQLFINWS